MLEGGNYFGGILLRNVSLLKFCCCQYPVAFICREKDEDVGIIVACCEPNFICNNDEINFT